VPRAEGIATPIVVVSARGLDHAPAVTFREHQVEHDDIGMLEAEPCQPLFPLADHYGVEARRRKMTCHAFGDDGVVFDD
jgi:hypothetical protein